MPSHNAPAQAAEDETMPQGTALIATEPFVGSDDYEQIRRAVIETARGRWFLTEHARRERADERLQLMSAIRRLERVAQENLEALRYSAVAEDVGRKLDSVLRSLPPEGAPSSEEQRRIEQRLIEPRPFLPK